MNLNPHVCKQCGGPINMLKMRCEYCGTSYENESLNRIVIQQVRPGVHTIACQVEIDRDRCIYNSEAARDYTLRELRNQIAEGLLGYMKLTTSENLSHNFGHTEIIRGEVRVVDPMFNNW